MNTNWRKHHTLKVCGVIIWMYYNRKEFGWFKLFGIPVIFKGEGEKIWF
jgi:hypothetical protein